MHAASAAKRLSSQLPIFPRVAIAFARLLPVTCHAGSAAVFFSFDSSIRFLM